MNTTIIKAGKSIFLRIRSLLSDAEEMIEKGCPEEGVDMLNKADGLKEALCIMFGLDQDDEKEYYRVAQLLMENEPV